MKLPKNIKTWTDSDHDKWVRSLTQDEWDSVADRTFTVTEYEVRLIDPDGDVADVDSFEKLSEAKKVFDSANLEPSQGLVLEKAKKLFSVADRGQQDVDYKTVETRGCLESLEAGGWA